MYQLQINENGEEELIIVGKTNIYEKIQQDLEGTRIENILHALAMGDLTALQQRQATYADITSMPKNLMEAQNMVLKMKQEFYEMPLEVRKEFNNSPEAYVAEMGTKSFLEKMAPYNEKIAKIKEAGDLETYNKKVAEAAKFNKDVNKAMEEGKTE